MEKKRRKLSQRQVAAFHSRVHHARLSEAFEYMFEPPDISDMIARDASGETILNNATVGMFDCVYYYPRRVYWSAGLDDLRKPLFVRDNWQYEYKPKQQPQGWLSELIAASAAFVESISRGNQAETRGNQDETW